MARASRRPGRRWRPGIVPSRNVNWENQARSGVVGEHPIRERGAGVIDAEEEHGVHPLEQRRDGAVAWQPCCGRTRSAQSPCESSTYVHKPGALSKCRTGARADGRTRTCSRMGNTDRICVARRRASPGQSRWPRSSSWRCPAPTRRRARAANSAHEITFWASADRVASLTDAPLDALRGHGGRRVHDGDAQFLDRRLWTDDPNAELEPGGEIRHASAQIRDSRIVQRAAARGIDLYLGFFAANATQRLDPVLRTGSTTRAGRARPRRWAASPAAARMLGFRGIAIDQELYGGQARWTWNYPGNTHTEAEVRSQGQAARPPGDDGDPGRLPRGRDRYLQLHAEGLVERIPLRGDRQPPLSPARRRTDTFAPRVDIDFWDGMTSVEGYSAIRQWNFVF